MGAVLPVALLALGTGVSAIGQIQAGKAEAAGAEAAARAAEVSSEFEAATEEQAGRFEARQQKRRSRALRSAQRAGFGAAGVGLLSPSALDVLSEQAITDETERQAILFGSQTRARQLRFGGKTQAQLSRFRGKAAKRASKIGAGTTLLTGAARTFTAGRELGAF